MKMKEDKKWFYFNEKGLYPTSWSIFTYQTKVSLRFSRRNPRFSRGIKKLVVPSLSQGLACNFHWISHMDNIIMRKFERKNIYTFLILNYFSMFEGFQHKWHFLVSNFFHVEGDPMKVAGQSLRQTWNDKFFNASTKPWVSSWKPQWNLGLIG